jgi:membrane-associated protein
MDSATAAASSTAGWLHALSQMHSTEGIQAIIAWGGLLVLIGIIFAETGILAGFFLPGDSLLVTAGVMTAYNFADPTALPPLDFVTVLVCLSIAAVAGDQVNYQVGKWMGARIWERPDGRFFKRKYLEEAHAFYDRHGGIALFAARFIPIARTFVPFAAGMARMRWRSFVGWNVGGGIVWVVSLVALGHWFGRIDAMRSNLRLLILAVVAVSLIPLVIGTAKRFLGKKTANV